MNRSIGYVTYLVKDYDEAIMFFTDKLGFELIQDSPQSDGKRWVLAQPPGSNGTSILLAKAATAEQAEAVGNQTGGRVFLFLLTDDFQRDYKMMRSKDVEFLEEPRFEEYGIVAVFKDLYGNKWDLLELKH